MYEKYSTQGMEVDSINRQWSAVLKNVYYPMSVSFMNENESFAQIEVFDFDSFSILNIISDPAKYTISSNDEIHNDDADFLITMPLKTELEYILSDGTMRCPVGAFVVEKANDSYDIEHFENNDIIVLKLPKKLLDIRLATPDRFCLAVFDCSQGIGKVFSDVLISVMKNRIAMKQNSVKVAALVLSDLLSVALADKDLLIKKCMPDTSTNHLIKAESYIKKNLTMPLTPEDIANHCEISVRYLHKIFSQQDKTVASWIKKLRLEKCRMDIEDNRIRRNIATISLRWGFVDQAHFSRSFKNAYGMSPAKWRRQFQK